MNTPITPLPWDSDCFGFKVARWSGTVDAANLDQGLREARKDGVRLVYAFLDPGDTEGHRILLEQGARAVDRKTLFGRPLVGIESSTQLLRPIPQREPSPALRELALASGAYSRFKLDPVFPGAAFEALYTAWIERSVSGEIADAVLVVEAEGRIAGMVTVKAEDLGARIGLIAVDASQRARGLGRQLIRGAEAWAFQAGCREMQVATQGDNRGACQLYERCGYEIVRVDCVYHLWC